MSKCCIVGTGKRFQYFLPVLKYLIKNGHMVINGIANRSGKFNSDCKQLTHNLYNNYTRMINQSQPDLIFLLVPAQSNVIILRDLCQHNLQIYTETPLYGISPVDIGLMIFKKQIIDSKICGNLTGAINDHRTYSYHGIAQLRNYLTTALTATKRRGNDLYLYSNDIVLLHKEPKQKDGKIHLLFDTEIKMTSDCIVSDNKSLVIQINGNAYNPEILFDNGILKTIKINIGEKEFVWNNEYQENLDQYQYGSLKSILTALNGHRYAPQSHIIDLS
jgi:hypothetical protein